MDRISTVLIGYGLGGRVFHGPLISAEPRLSLDGIVTGNAERAAQAQSRYPQARIYATAEEAIAAGHELVAISTANVTHVPYARAALDAGSHVVLDKPIAPNAATSQELAVQAEEAGRLLIPFQNRRWDSDVLTVKAVMASGALGDVHRFESRIVKQRIVPREGWRLSPAVEDMGGLLYDLGVHVIDQALQVMGPVETVAAWARSVRPADDTDDDVVVVLTHSSGAISVLTVSQVQAFGEPRMTVFGTRGGLRIDVADSQEPELDAGLDPSQPDWGTRAPGTEALLRTFDDASNPSDTLVTLRPGAWPTFYRGVADAIEGSAPAPVLVEDVIATMRVLDAARQATASGSIVRLDPPAAHR